MITTPEEYFKYLWGIEAKDENGNVINPYNNKPILSIILPSDERTFDVDLSTRQIYVPTFLSVAKDHRAETIYFLVDRYYEYKDLATTSCMIEFINAAGEGGFYPVPFYDISTHANDIDENGIALEPKMLIPWCLEGDVTKAAGPVKFVLRFYELNNGGTEFIYNLRTAVAEGEVLNGLDETEIDDEPIDTELKPSLIHQLNDKYDNITTTIYWTDL